MTEKAWICAGIFLIGTAALGDIAEQSAGVGSQANVIEVPAYQGGPKDVAPEFGETQKLEYEPVNEELPPLEKREMPAEEKPGSTYEAGAELMLVKTPEFKPTGTNIEDPPATSFEVEEVTPASMTGEL